MNASFTRIAVGVGVVILATMLCGLLAFSLIRLWPHHDTTPIEVARQDEKTAGVVSQAVGAKAEAANTNATLTIDLVKKDIADAFNAVPPAPPAAVGVPRDLPAAPVDQLRIRLNESIARSNRAADAADAPD